MPPASLPRGGARPPVGRTARQPPIPTRFSQGLCQCCNDPNLACTMWCCGPTATGQIYERITVTPRSCFYISTALWSILFLGSTLMSVANAYFDGVVYMDSHGGIAVDNDKLTTGTIIMTVGSSVSFLGTLISTCVLCSARQRIRSRDNIAPETCGDLEDCCVAYWCGCCALTQMFAHEGVAGHSYNLVSTTGS